MRIRNLSLLLGLACIACGDGNSDTPRVDLGGAGGVGGAGGAGGAGGTGGGVGGAGGAGGIGGVGGAGGAGGVGGVGGAGGMGGAGGAGGMGGASIECDPECPTGSVCDNGECRFEACPDGLFECDGLCVDLLTDADHCGACGNRCADDWPINSVSFEDANIDATCEQAECAFACADAPDIGGFDLADDPSNCGACGQECPDEVRYGLSTRCEEFGCSCFMLTQFLERFEGRTCDGDCTMAGGNCANGCCPELPMGQVDGQPTDGPDHFIFTLDVASPQRIQVEADDDACGRLDLLRYRPDGYVEWMGSSTGCDPIDDPLLPAGRYGVTVWTPQAYRITRSSRFMPLLDGLGSIEVSGNDGSLGVPFRLAERTSVAFGAQERSGDCEAAWSMGLFAADGYQIWGDEGRNCSRFRSTGAAVLPAGDYVFVLRARELDATYAVTLSAAAEGDWSALRPHLGGPGSYLQPRINGDERAEFRVSFPENGAYRIRTADPDGVSCMNDTVLSVVRQLRGAGDRAIAHNNNTDTSPCSEVIINAEANANYMVYVRGYDGRFVDPYALIIE